MLRGGLARRDQLLRIFIAKILQGEGAALRNLYGGCQQLGRIQLPQRAQRSKMALAIGETLTPDLVDRRLETSGGQHIMQRPPIPNVVVDIAYGYNRQRKLLAASQQRIQPLGAVLLEVMSMRQVSRDCRQTRKPLHGVGGDLPTWNPQGDRLGDRAAFEVRTADAVGAFGSRTACAA